jgi:hypothetical protein
MTTLLKPYFTWHSNEASLPLRRSHPSMRLVTLLLAFVTTTSYAQQATSPWQGEWGDDSPSAGRLSISTCDQQSCTFTLHHGGCGVSQRSSFHLQSPTDATIDLPGQDATHSCHVQFHHDAAKPTIEVKQSGDGCAYYCIPGGTGFDTQLTQRSPVVYFGSHSEECMQGAGPARRSTCLDASLATLEEEWDSLFNEFPLVPVTKESNHYQLSIQVDTAIMAQCNSAADPALCLRTRFTKDIALMKAKRTAFIAGYTERGDPAEGGRLARSIAGRYRHSFENGDVQGHSYRSTDTLKITPVGRASISFDAELSFFNGHSCSIGGGALYRKDGSFVFDDDPADAVPGDDVCHLAIVPTAKGVAFKDLNGSCKMAHCGARGSLDGAEFTFRERVAAKPAAASSKPPAK